MTMLVEPQTSQPESTRQPSQRRRWLFLAAVVSPLVTFLTAYLAFFTPDSPSRLRLSTTDQPSAAPSFEIPLGTWSVAPGSVTGYRVREKLLRLPAPNDAVGRTEAVRGAFELQRRGGHFVVERGLRVDVDVSTLKSDESRRDDHMRTMAIETDRFPTASFASTADLAVPEEVALGRAARVSVAGELTLHGVTRPVTIPLDVQLNGSQIEVVSSLTFGWALFEIEPPNLSYVTVEDSATLEFRLLFEHGAPLL